MLLRLFELPVELAIITAIVLPIVAVCFFIITIPWLKNGGGSRLRRYLSYAITPPQLTSDESVNGDDVQEGGSGLSRDDKVKLYFYYIGIALFLVSFIIGEFYEVIIDVMIPINQGSTGEYREITSVVFQSFFNAGWVGSMPWFGFSTYHETWDWIFYTAAITDNPHFLAAIVEVLVLFSIGVGIAFLSPLVIKSIRHSFVPSLFFFMTGMTIFTKAAVGYFAGALHLLYSTIVFEYTPLVVTGSMIPNYSGVITSCVLLIVPMFAFFVLLGRKLWKNYYTDSKSKNWFTVYITLVFWIGLFISMVM